MPSRPPDLAFSRSARLGIAALAWLSAASVPASPAGGEAEARPEYRMMRMAAGGAVPAIYFSQVETVFRRCGGKPRGQADSGGIPCAEIAAASRLVDSAYLDNKKLNQFADSTRRRLVRSFRMTYRPAKALEDPEFFRKVRFMSHLDTGVLLRRLRLSPVSDSVLKRVESLSKGLKGDSLERERMLAPIRRARRPDSARLGEEAKYALLMNRIFPGLDGFLRLSDYARRLPSMDSLWSDNPLQEAFAGYELEKVFDLIRNDTLKANLRAPLKGLFVHKLRNLLHDAVWLEDNAGRDYSLSSYLFGSSHVLSPADSVLIMDQIERFGRNNADLAVRVDVRKRASLQDPRLQRLDRLVSVEIGKICAKLTGRFTKYLEDAPASAVAFGVAGSEYPDYFSLGRMAGQYLLLLREAREFQGVPLLARVGESFPLLAPEMQAKLEALAPQDAKKALVDFLKAGSAAERNAFYLVLGPTTHHDFEGSSSTAEKIVKGMTKI